MGGVSDAQNIDGATAHQRGWQLLSERKRQVAQAAPKMSEIRLSCVGRWEDEWKKEQA